MGRYLGQHFLRNKSAIGNIIAALELEAGDKVVEIGPGKGALTLPLLKKIEEKTGKLIVIEKDAALIPELSGAVDNLGRVGDIEIIEGDALKILPQITEGLSQNEWKLVGNIPYYITGHLFRIIGELEKKPKIIVLMIQKEVAERVTAKPPKMNLLAAATQVWADISIIQTLKPDDFEPAPEVESGIVKLNIKNQISKINLENLPKYYYFIKLAFKQPRKTLFNNLATSDQPLATREEVMKILRQMGYDEKTRAQNLSIEELWKLSKLF